MSTTWDEAYLERHQRQIGIMTPKQLQLIRQTPVAVAGLGLGGSVFINLVRLGFETFHVADPDIYERSNVGRQRAAKEATLGCRKDDCLIQEARAINPEVRVTPFREGVNAGNVRAFLDGMAWVVDAVDVFAMPDKIALHEEVRSRDLPVVTCSSAGFGASIVLFDSQTPSFTELSGIRASAPYEVNMARWVSFAVPELPAYMKAQVEKAYDKSSHIPFVVPGVEIAAALACTALCKHLLGLGERVAAPTGIYLDPVAVRLEKFQADFRARNPKKSAA